MNHPIRFISVCISSFALVVCSSFVYSQEAQYRTLQVDGPRALAEAMLNLMRNHPGIAITYEDPRYRYVGDVQDVSSQIPGAARNRVLAPRSSSVLAEYSVLTASNRLAEPGVAISRIVDAYNSANNPGTFKIEESGSIFHIIPQNVRDTNGNLVSEQSILDLAISFRTEEGNGLKVLNQICEELSSLSGHVVGLGVSPPSVLASTEMDFSASGEKARSALVRLFSMLEASLVWQLDYDPSTDWYFLNILSTDPPKVILDRSDFEISTPIELDPNSGSIFRPRQD